jgi:tetratricopeptide (TPR) repeat protein
MGDLPGALTAYQKAIAIKPDLADAHYGMGVALRAQEDLSGAIVALRRAIELEPHHASAHLALGVSLRAQGDLTGAIAAYQEAIAIKPDFADAHYALGNALQADGNHPAAIAAFRKVIELQPQYAEAHCNLGHALRDCGAFREALASLQRGHELGSKKPKWQYTSEQWIQACQRLVELDEELPAILQGQQQPTDAAECLELAWICSLKGFPLAAARLLQQVLKEQPSLIKWQHRYLAIRAAARAGCRQGKDSAQLDDAEAARWRRQAAAWLKAPLVAWSNLDGKTTSFRDGVHKCVVDLQRHTDLACLRDEESLARLPDAERALWQQMWNEVESIRVNVAKQQP